MNDHYERVARYFGDKAEEYDRVDEQLYWVLSDTFYKRVLKKKLTAFMEDRQEVRVLDAGAGTGRWTLAFEELFGDTKDISGHLIDISPEMLNVAKRKLAAHGLSGKYTTEVGNIEEMEQISESDFDIALSFYNVLSFVERPELAISQIRQKLKPGGMHIAVVGNTYHALYFSIFLGREKEIDRVLTNSEIAFNDVMPPMKCFTPEELTSLYTKAGYGDIEVRGGPNFIYPGMEETFVRGQSPLLQMQLSNTCTFAKILDAEEKFFDRPDVVGRGNTLIVFAKT